MKKKIIVGTPHRADLHIEADIQVNDSGNLEILGIPGVTYEMYDKELCLFAFSENNELNYEGEMLDWNIVLDGKPLEEGMEYFIFDPKTMELTETILDPESQWNGLMFWTVQDALKHLKRKFEGELMKVYTLSFDGPPHYLLKI
jgi:hypothetical protein